MARSVTHCIECGASWRYPGAYDVYDQRTARGMVIAHRDGCSRGPVPVGGRRR